MVMPIERMIGPLNRFAHCPGAELEQVENDRGLGHFGRRERRYHPWHLGRQDPVECLLIATAGIVSVGALFRKAEPKGTIADARLNEAVETSPQPIVDCIYGRRARPVFAICVIGGHVSEPFPA